MKQITEYINESKKDLLQLTWKDVVDYTGSSDNTLTKGSICIGAEGKKFHTEYWDNKLNDEYESFVKAYKAAGGKIEEETARQGMYEVFCNYEGDNEACKYIILSFARLAFGKYVK